MLEENNANLLANMIDNQLPEGYGFCLLLFPFNENSKDNRMQYISNANRDDIAKAMKEWIDKVDQDNFGKDI